MASRNFRLAVAVVALGLAGCRPGTAAEPYDPLKSNGNEVAIETLELTVHDARRDRDIPILAYLPPGGEPAPVILFSHGLGGTRETCAYLGRHWAANGYLGIFLQHPGSDDSVWRDQPLRERMNAMDAAASGANFLLRVQDVPAVLDQLEAWNKTADGPLAARPDLTRVGMSGHSFGAVTTQAVSGQSFGPAGQRFTDPRIRAALPMSPSAARRETGGNGFEKVAIPWLLMTGTEDTSPIGDITLEQRLAVFPALPAGDKYELVLDGGQHSAFTERGLPGDSGERNPNHHRVILGLSTAFWDAYLKGDAAALAWLQGDGAKALLEPGDRWRMK